MNRMKQITHQLNGGAVKTLSALTYDELGRMLAKNTGQIENATYEYNIRGWLRKIDGSKFSQELRDTTHPYYGSISFFNGNITTLFWKDPLNSSTKKGLFIITMPWGESLTPPTEKGNRYRTK